jgi:hypothetical protein
VTTSLVALELAASLGGPQTTDDGLQQPSIRVRRIPSGTPENVFALKRSIEAWYRSDQSDRRLLKEPGAVTVRPGPVLDATKAVVSRVST